MNYVFSPIALIALVVGIVGSVYFTCQDVEGKVANVPGYCETRGLEFNILAGYIGVRTPKDGVYDDIACQVYKTDFGTKRLVFFKGYFGYDSASICSYSYWWQIRAEFAATAGIANDSTILTTNTGTVTSFPITRNVAPVSPKE